jgi:glutamine synthetase
VPGSDVNPYLTIAGVLASIRDGIDTAIAPGPESSGDAYLQETTPLPRNLGAAGEVFKNSAFVRDQFGQEVVDQYSAAALWEWSCFENVVTEWEHDRYYENI